MLSLAHSTNTREEPRADRWSGHQNTLDRLCPGVGLAGAANRWGTGLANVSGDLTSHREGQCMAS